MAWRTVCERASLHEAAKALLDDLNEVQYPMSAASLKKAEQSSVGSSVSSESKDLLALNGSPFIYRE